MKYVFFGTPEFAAVILEKLVQAGSIPAAVVCNPDKPTGRKKIITAPPVKQLIAKGKAQIKILQPENLTAISDKLSVIKPDFALVAAYAKILPKEILAIPRLGIIGVHPSLLPKYRGSSPIQQAILDGEEKTGVTLYLLDEKMDHGSIIAKSEINIHKKDTFPSLRDKLAELGADLLIETLPRFINGKITPLPQDESQATYTKKFTTEDAYIDLDKDEGQIIERKVHALNPGPGTWTMQNGKRVKILEVKLIDGKLKLKKIQVEGKKPELLKD